MEFIKDMLGYIIVIVIVILLRNYVIAPAEVFEESMNPNLKDGDIIMLNKVSYRFGKVKRFDVIVFDYIDTKYLIKRVIGLPGEYIEYKDNKLYVDNKKVNEKHLNDIITGDFSLKDLGYEKIPDNMYLVLGDNREISIDSRKIGLVEREEITGKAFFILYPFNRLNLVK
ncbi:MAG: signal peptidase I [Bacilli bacterium]